MAIGYCNGSKLTLCIRLLNMLKMPLYYQIQSILIFIMWSIFTTNLPAQGEEAGRGHKRAEVMELACQPIKSWSYLSVSCGSRRNRMYFWAQESARGNEPRQQYSEGAWLLLTRDWKGFAHNRQGWPDHSHILEAKCVHQIGGGGVKVTATSITTAGDLTNLINFCPIL